MSSTVTDTRPRPRPKPRPKQPANASATASGSQDGTTFTPASSAASVPKITYENVQDDDEMFMRNRGRDKVAWARLEKISREQEKAVIVVDSDSDSDLSPRRKNAVGRRKKAGDMSRWEKKLKLVRALSQDLSGGESDDSIVIQGTGNNKNNHKRSKDKKRQRSRSRSITPPPDVPEYLLQNAKKIVRETFRSHTRAASPTQYDDLADESTDTIILDPQLAKIAQNVKSRSELIGLRSSSIDPLEGGSGSSESITITVRWQPHPENEFGRQDVWGFRLDRTDNFSDLFNSVADEASILADRLVMTFRGKRFFPSVTPNALHIWGEAEFTACDQSTYDYMRKNAVTQIATQPQPKPQPENADPNVIELDSDPDEVFVFPQSSAESHEKESDAGAESQTENNGGGGGEDDKFKLVLRSNKTPKDVTLFVRPTTKCGAIVKAFLKKAGLADQYPAAMNSDGVEVNKPSPKKKRKKADKAVDVKIPMLCVDGDKLGNDTAIGEMDLEDGDMVEVVGL